MTLLFEGVEARVVQLVISEVFRVGLEFELLDEMAAVVVVVLLVVFCSGI
jgi:hypothetical protein